MRRRVIRAGRRTRAELGQRIEPTDHFAASIFAQELVVTGIDTCVNDVDDCPFTARPPSRDSIAAHELALYDHVRTDSQRYIDGRTARPCILCSVCNLNRGDERNAEGHANIIAREGYGAAITRAVMTAGASCTKATLPFA